MADVPDAPDALVERLRADAEVFDAQQWANGLGDRLRAAADRIEAHAALIAEQDEMIHEIAGLPMTAEDHASMDRVGKRLFGEDFSLGPFVPTSEYAALNARLAEAERLLKDSLRAVPPREAIEAFLAGFAAPPEAPQQTAPEPAWWVIDTIGEHDMEPYPLEATARRIAAERNLAEPVVIGRWIVRLAGATAPTEADRP